MKTNIALICLLENYSKSVAKQLAEKLEMFYVNVDEMIEFELGDENHILETLGDTAGHKYIEECENKVVKNVTTFENTVICMNPAEMFTQDNFNVKNIISTQEFSSNFINAIKEGLGLSDLRENLSENTLNTLTNTLSKMTLGQIVAEFNSILKLNPRDLFNSNMLNFAKGHREINNIISDMIKNGNLMEKC